MRKESLVGLGTCGSRCWGRVQASQRTQAADISSCCSGTCTSCKGTEIHSHGDRTVFPSLPDTYCLSISLDLPRKVRGKPCPCSSVKSMSLWSVWRAPQDCSQCISLHWHQKLSRELLSNSFGRLNFSKKFAGLIRFPCVRIPLIY